MLDVPIINVRSIAAKQLAEICHDVGFFCLEGHAIPTRLLDAVRNQTRLLFDLPEADKRALQQPPPHYRGYFGAQSNPDLKEGFDIWTGLPFGTNVWPDALPEFREVVDELHEYFKIECAMLTGLLSATLRLPVEMDKPIAQTTFVRYPPQRLARKGQIGCGIHTDYGTVSLIWQMDEPGLQVQTPDGEWLEVLPNANNFVCVIGDMIQRWTNDYWLATPHRVVNDGDRMRYSAAFFFAPNWECMIEPLPSYVSAARPARHTLTSVGEHIAQAMSYLET